MNDHPQICRDCHDGQLVGQWYADLLGLGKLFDPAHLRSAVQQIYRRNATPRGVRKGVRPDGQESPNPPSSRWWSEAGQGWPGYEVAHYAALAMYQGEVADALATVERVYQELHVHGGATWNQPLRWNLASGMTYGWGCDRYMNSPAVWFVYLALIGVVIDRPAKALALRPRLLPGENAMDVSIFLPGNWGRMQVVDSADARTLTLRFDTAEPIAEIRVEAVGASHVAVDGTSTDYMVEPAKYGTTPEFRICFAEDVHLGPEGLTVRLMR